MIGQNRNYNNRKFISEISRVQRLLSLVRFYQKHCNLLEWVEEVYDDPKRRVIRKIRAKEGGLPNILFDDKRLAIGM